MKYYKVDFTIQPCSQDARDILAAMAGEVGFETFEESEEGLTGYVQQALFNQEALEQTIEYFPIVDTRILYKVTEAEDKDWNKLWEENYFQPLVVDGRCVVYGTMHKDVPTAEYNIIINPKMSFGTGHHATTSQMLSEILKTDVRGFEVLDMGCGTSILAILAKMMLR